MANISKKLSTGAEMSGRALKIQTLKAECLMKESQIKGIKQELGVKIYDALEASDDSEVARIFAEFKAKVDAVNAEVAKKKTDIAEMEKLQTPR